MGILNKIQQTFVGWFNKDNNANFLFTTAAIGWILASCAQTFGVVVNKELSKEEKRFLVPQEIADGAANIGLYALVTTNMMKGAEKLCKPGKNGKPFIGLKNEAGQILDYATHGAEYAKMGRNLKTGAAILGGIISTCILTPIARNAFAGYMKKRADRKNPENRPAQFDVYSGRTQPYFTRVYNATPQIQPKQTFLNGGTNPYQNTGALKI